MTINPDPTEQEVMDYLTSIATEVRPGTWEFTVSPGMRFAELDAVQFARLALKLDLAPVGMVTPFMLEAIVDRVAALEAAVPAQE